MVESIGLKLSSLNPKMALVVAALGTGGVGVGSYVDAIGEHVIKVERMEVHMNQIKDHVTEVKEDVNKLDIRMEKIDDKLERNHKDILKILLEMKNK